MYRSQLLLQQLGISQWIPKTTQTVTQPSALLWRDQDALPMHTPLLEQQSVSVTQTQVMDTAVQPIQNALEQIKQAVVSQIISPEASHLTTDLAEQSNLEKIEVRATISFSAHMLLHENFILFAEIHSEHQQILFNRIAHACHVTEQRLLQWPLAIEFWEVSDDIVDAYLQGVFAQHRQKVCIVLGESNLPDLKNYFKQQIICANLEQLLESPQQKRALWQQLYPLVYDVENQNAQEGRDI